MTEVKVVGGNIEQAISRFKKTTAGLLKELRLRRSFESKPAKRRRKAKESRRRIAKRAKKMEEAKRTLYRPSVTY